MYEKTSFAGWGDIDFNAHMRNTAFLDKAVDVRIMFFTQHGFSMEEFLRRQIGPVVLRDEVEYFREVGLLQPFRITLAVAGLADDGTRWQIRNEFFSEDGKLLARLTSTGGWLDLEARRMVAPPDTLFAALQSLSRTDDFQVLDSLRRPAPNR